MLIVLEYISYTQYGQTPHQSYASYNRCLCSGQISVHWGTFWLLSHQSSKSFQPKWRESERAGC